MYVEIDFSSGAPAGIALRESEDFKSFKVVTLAATESGAQLAEAVAAIGTVDDDGHVWLSTDALVELAGARGVEPDWAASFAAMLDYARSHGFLSADGTEVRAHVERGGGGTT
jgi:hypothetical protein